MKVLVITYYWPPAGGSGVQRWLKFVKYLPGFSIDPVVYTVQDANYPVLDETLESEVPASVKVLRQPIKEPNTWFSFLGSRNKETSAGFLKPKPSLFGKLLQYIRANYFIPDARKFWIKPSVKYLRPYLKMHPVDVIITTGPPHSLHLIGMQLKKEMNLKWIADFRDPWTDIDYFHQLPLTKATLKKHQQLEQAVIRSADRVLVVSNSMKEKYVTYNKQTQVITNGFDGELNDGSNQPDEEFSLVHIGMMNADRNPVLLWEVLKELMGKDAVFARKLKIKLIGKVADEVVESLEQFDLFEKTLMIPYIAHHEVLKFQKNAQVLLLPVNRVPAAKGIVTGKVFEYLQAARPILAIGPVDGDLAEIVLHAGAGVIVDFDDREHLRKAVLNFFEDYKKGKLTVSSKNIQQYHRKKLTEILVNSLKDICEDA